MCFCASSDIQTSYFRAVPKPSEIKRENGTAFGCLDKVFFHFSANLKWHLPFPICVYLKWCFLEKKPANENSLNWMLGKHCWHVFSLKISIFLFDFKSTQVCQKNPNHSCRDYSRAMWSKKRERGSF